MATAELIQLLDDWDFLQVMNEKEKTYDEYYDLVNPILSKLESNPSEKELEKYIDEYIRDRYGVKPANIKVFVEKVMKWWSTFS